MLTFKPTFSLSSFTFIMRLFSSSLSAIKMVLSAYLGLLIFLPAILIPASASSKPAFLIMYSAYKLNKQGNNIQPWCTLFPIWDETIFVLWCLAYSTWQNVFKFHLYHNIYQNFLLLEGWIIFHWCIVTVAQIMKSLLLNSYLNWRKWGKPLDHSGMT